MDEKIMKVWMKNYEKYGWISEMYNFFRIVSGK